MEGEKVMPWGKPNMLLTKKRRALGNEVVLHINLPLHIYWWTRKSEIVIRKKVR